MLSLDELLAELVRRPSVNPMGRTDIPESLAHEGRVSDFLCTQAAFARWPVAPGRDNLVATFRPPGAAVHLLWEAHQDTVPVDGMTVPPFAAEVRDGKLYGRGACDVKAGIACMLFAFQRLMRENPPGAAAVTLAFTVDEEHTFLGAQELAKHVRADFAIVAEPTGLNIVVAHKGVVRWKLETSGRACHSSRPHEGINAVYGMAKILAALETYAGTLANGPTLSVGRIEGGTSPNTVPDFCRIDIDRRLVPGETAAGAEAGVRHALRGLDFALAQVLCCPPLEATTHPLLEVFGRAVGPHRREHVAYGTDASTLAEAGIACVVFGPGDIAQAHTRDEFVDLSEVARAAEILFRFAAGPHA